MSLLERLEHLPVAIFDLPATRRHRCEIQIIEVSFVKISSISNDSTFTLVDAYDGDAFMLITCRKHHYRKYLFVLTDGIHVVGLDPMNPGCTRWIELIDHRIPRWYECIPSKKDITNFLDPV